MRGNDCEKSDRNKGIGLTILLLLTSILFFIVHSNDSAVTIGLISVIGIVISIVNVRSFYHFYHNPILSFCTS